MIIYEKVRTMIMGDDYEDYDEKISKSEHLYLKESLMDVIIAHHEIIKIIVQTKFGTMITGDYNDRL